MGLLDDNDLATTLTVVADHRGVQLRPFLPALARMPQTVQGRWSAWRTRLRRDDELPGTRPVAHVYRDHDGDADPVTCAVGPVVPVPAGYCQVRLCGAPACPTVAPEITGSARCLTGPDT